MNYTALVGHLVIYHNRDTEKFVSIHLTLERRNLSIVHPSKIKYKNIVPDFLAFNFGNATWLKKPSALK